MFAYEGKDIVAEDGETVLSALLRSGVAVDNRCRAGACQSCLLRTTSAVPAVGQAGLDDDLIEQGVFISCQTPADGIDHVHRLGDDAFPKLAATLRSAEWQTDDVLLVSLNAPGWTGRPGRFIRLYHPSGIMRPYSVASAAWESSGIVQLHVRVIPGGAMSEILVHSLPGDEFTIQGPFGKCSYKVSNPDQPILLIGSGTGLAPLYGIATDALTQGHEGLVHLYHGAATSSRLYFRERLMALAERFANFRFVTCADSELTGIDRLGSPLTHALEEHKDLDGYKVYLCGHPALVRLAQRKCFLEGASLRDIAADPFEAS